MGWFLHHPLLCKKEKKFSSSIFNFHLHQIFLFRSTFGDWLEPQSDISNSIPEPLNTANVTFLNVWSQLTSIWKERNGSLETESPWLISSSGVIIIQNEFEMKIEKLNFENENGNTLNTNNKHLVIPFFSQLLWSSNNRFHKRIHFQVSKLQEVVREMCWTQGIQGCPSIQVMGWVRSNSKEV